MGERGASGGIADDPAVLEIHPVADILPREMDGLIDVRVVQILGIIGDLRGKARPLGPQIVGPEPFDRAGRGAARLDDGLTGSARRVGQADLDRKSPRPRPRMAPLGEKPVEPRRRMGEGGLPRGIAGRDLGNGIGGAGESRSPADCRHQQGCRHQDL